MEARLLIEIHARGCNPGSQLVVNLVVCSLQLMPQYLAGVRAIFERVFAKRGTKALLGTAINHAVLITLVAADGRRIPYNKDIWCIVGDAQDWLQDLALRLDPAGFVAVRLFLEAVNNPTVFAAGYVAVIFANPQPKTGLFAMRQGLPLVAKLASPAPGLSPAARFEVTTTTGYLTAVGTYYYTGQRRSGPRPTG